MIYTCTCGFTCASEQVFKMHQEREAAGVSPYKEKQIIKEHREEYLKAEDKVAVLKKYSDNQGN